MTWSWLRAQRLVFALAPALALGALLVGDSPLSAQQPLSDAADAVASSWAGGDADAIARVLSPGGVALHLLDQSQPAAGVRQARAALADLLTGGGSARVVRVEELGGTPRRGFAELDWEVRDPGSPGGLRYVVFLGFVEEEEGWRIAELRVLR